MYEPTCDITFHHSFFKKEKIGITHPPELVEVKVETDTASSSYTFAAVTGPLQIGLCQAL